MVYGRALGGEVIASVLWKNRLLALGYVALLVRYTLVGRVDLDIYIEGIGLWQICDWCSFLWAYKDSLNRG